MTEVGGRAVSVLVGAHTRAAVTTADLVRDSAADLAAAGVVATRQRAAARRLAPMLAHPTPAGGSAFLDALGVDAGRRAFLCHLNGLGELSRAVGERVLYPDAEQGIAALTLAFARERLRLIVGIAPLSRFFTTAKGPMAKAVRKAGWHRLYDLSWADRIEMICDIAPEADVLVLTDRGTALESATATMRLFGTNIGGDDAYLLPMLDAGGQDRRRAGAGTAADLLAAHGLRPDPDTLAARGIDEALSRLLDDRFDDDLRRLQALDKVTVI